MKLGKGTGRADSPDSGVSRTGAGNPRNNVGVAVADGACGDVSARVCVQALITRSTIREVNILLFIPFPSKALGSVLVAESRLGVISFCRYHSRIF